MSLRIRPYSFHDEELWDCFNENSLQGTFLHSRKFISYHKDRFKDCSLILEYDDKCVGLFPAAISPADDALVVSHPGITYGGLVHHGGLRGERMLEALTLIKAHYQEEGYEKLIYKAVPTFYHYAPAQDDLYALFRLGAKRFRCDLSSTIDLLNRMPISERRRRSLKKAKKASIKITQGIDQFNCLWDILIENLQSKHGATPVHSLEEILELAKKFPKNINCVCAYLNEKIVAGVVFFKTRTVCHAQYIASNGFGQEVCALDMIFDYEIGEAIKNGSRWFDFGISNENQGQFLNDGLYRFKTEFGGGGMVHEFFQLDLTGGKENVT